MGKAQLEELEKHGVYFIVPQGNSMRPMLRNKKDIVEIRRLERPARRYDLVMYTRGKKQQGVIHRVLHVRDRDYIIAGDNCWRKEYIPHENVAGIVTRFRRGEKWTETDNPWYQIYVHFWTDSFFIRRPILYMRDLGKRAIRKIKWIIKTRHP